MTNIAQKNGKVNKELFTPVKDHFVKLVGENTFNKEVSFALQLMHNNDYLAECDRSSLLISVLNVAQVGLTLNPAMRLAYLVPRKGKACLEPSYQGLVKLVTDTGSANSVYAYLVFEGDQFEVSMGTQVEITHKPTFAKAKKITHAYAVAELPETTLKPRWDPLP